MNSLGTIKIQNVLTKKNMHTSVASLGSRHLSGRGPGGSLGDLGLRVSWGYAVWSICSETLSVCKNETHSYRHPWKESINHRWHLVHAAKRPEFPKMSLNSATTEQMTSATRLPTRLEATGGGLWANSAGSSCSYKCPLVHWSWHACPVVTAAEQG